MTAKTLDARWAMRTLLQEQLTKLAIKYAKDEPKLQQIKDLQSQLVPDEIDDKVLGHVFIAVGRDFEYIH